MDTQGPTLLGLVEEVDLSCSQNLNQVPIPTAEDACSPVLTVVWTDEEVSGGCTQPISALVRTYTAIDACNNVTQADQIIQLTDVEAPEWSFLPEDNTLECTDTYVLVPAEATDNCATPSVTWEVDTVGVVSEGVYSLVFDFTAVDDCDNLIEPTACGHRGHRSLWATFPEDHTMNCDEELDSTMPTATDACGQTVEITLVDDEFFSDGRDWGLDAHVLRVDATAMWWSPLKPSSGGHRRLQFSPVPEAMTPWNAPTDMAEATDACSVATTVSETAESWEWTVNCQQSHVIRTFTATDACRQQTDTTQTVTVVDTTPPIHFFP